MEERQAPPIFALWQVVCNFGMRRQGTTYCARHILLDNPGEYEARMLNVMAL
jgi:hypothetical protein